MSHTPKTPFRLTVACCTLLLTASVVLPAAVTLSGCGNSAPVVKLDDVVELTEDTLTEALLGPADVPTTSNVPRDPPLLKKGVFETVLIAADEKGFVTISKGGLRDQNIHEIEDRVTRTVDKRLTKRGFHAKRVSFPPAESEIQGAELPLVATLVPTTQDAGSDQDRAKGRGKQLILVRLTISDPKTNTILIARDYYSGSDVPNGGKSHWGDDRRFRRLR